jgi:hypothetical protein
MSDAIASMQQRDKFRVLLRERGVSLRRMSMDLGLNESYFQQFVTYGRPAFIEGDILRQACEYLGVDAGKLTPSHSGFHEPHPPSRYDATFYRGATGRRLPEGALTLLPCYDMAKRIDAEIWRNQDKQVPCLAFSQQFLQLLTSANPESLAVLRIDNDAMAPTLGPGDYVLLDTSYTVASEDGIYALLHESHLLVKRFTIDPIRKQVTLSRDNSAYPATREYSLVDVRVAGRVIWVGKKL